MELKDYLHLYLGCEAILNTDHWFSPEGDQKVIITGYFGGDYPYAFYSRGGNTSGNDQIKYFKPILRPISDMTEEEKKAISYEAYQIMRKQQPSTLPTTERSCRWAATQTAYLLSRGFDLFGLIEAGLAIDKTKQP